MPNALAVGRTQGGATLCVTAAMLRRKLAAPNGNGRDVITTEHEAYSLPTDRYDLDLARFDAAQRKAGVVAFSSGNHAQAVALSAKLLGLKATIVMPVTTPHIKVSAVAARGARVILGGLHVLSCPEEAAPHADAFRIFQDEPELGVFLDNRDDVAPDLEPQHRGLDVFVSGPGNTR